MLAHVGNRCIQFPAQAVIQGQIGLDLPTVLGKQVQSCAADMLHLSGALPIGTWEAEHVVGKHSIANRAIGGCTIDKELAIDVKIKSLVKVLAANICTKFDGVRANNFADAVRPLE